MKPMRGVSRPVRAHARIMGVTETNVFQLPNQELLLIR